jgi:hypothetical protein
MNDWETVRVKGLGKLVEAMERADDKGYLPDAIREEWDAFMLDIADGGKGEAVAYTTPEAISALSRKSAGMFTVHSFPQKLGSVPLYTAPQAECAPRMWIETGYFGSNEPPRLVVDRECATPERAPCGSGMIDAMEDFAPVPAPREAQPIYLVSSEGRFWQIVSEPVWVNWQADYRNVLYTAAREVQPVNIEKEDDSEIACISCGLTLGESRLITSHAERKGRGYITKDAVERAKRVMAAVDTYHERPDGGNRHALRSILMDEFEELLAAPTPECAPREAQPVGPRTTLNYDGTFDTTCAHCGGNGCFACLKSAAPTPERADAEKDAALPDWRIADGWHNTFSTSNPYCPCDLKSFTKAVRWAERAILATNKK